MADPMKVLILSVVLLGTASAAVQRVQNKIVTLKGDPKGILKPQDSESRIVKSLDGIWNFRVAPRMEPECGFQEKWYSQPLEKTGEVQPMPVPSSYNDITECRELRDHVGWVWYDREFFVPSEWLDEKNRIFLRVGAANYYSIVYVNSVLVTKHAGGSLPFQVELNSTVLKAHCVNRITIAVNNTLTPTTIPQGKIKWLTDERYPRGSFIQETGFDFFNYAGIHRSVVLYTTPRSYIDDVDVTTRIVGTTGYVKYFIKAYTDAEEPGCVVESSGSIEVKLEDKLGNVCASARGASGEIAVPHANLWWPYTMVKNNSMAGYQYTLVITLTDSSAGSKDIYRLKVGIRSITWSSTGFFINGQAFYFRGIGHHEEADIRGRGLDEVTIVKDHNVMKWLGVNSYRTTHYPPSEESLDIADELGIVVIEESASVSLRDYCPELLAAHKEHLREMIQRDKNRASIVMWSMGNEPDVKDEKASDYFRELIEYFKELDSCHRPVTIVSPGDISCAKDCTMKYVDIISINRYYGFYDDAGNLDVITKAVVSDVEECVRLYKKPLLFSEYGFPTVAGLHRVPSFIYTEEYQTDGMRQYFKAFDELRNEHTPIIGEMIWSFADFMTKQQFFRVDGNKEGIMTRERQPKAGAHLLRQRYFLLALQMNEFPLPEDLPSYMPVYGSQFMVHTNKGRDDIE